MDMRLCNLVNHGGIVIPNCCPAGFLMSFQIAVYSFIGIELIGVTAGETKDRTVIPKAINNVPVKFYYSMWEAYL